METDGTFSLSIGATGIRRLLVIGKGKQPIRVLGVDITVGEQRNIGVVDLTGACPQ